MGKRKVKSVKKLPKSYKIKAKRVPTDFGLTEGGGK
jgi:hypothetical protein